MHRKAEKKRRWQLWEKNERHRDNQASEQRTKNCYRASLDNRFLVSRRKNKGQIKKKMGTIGFCHFCGSEGVIVEKFPRRGYGKFNAGF